MKIEKIIQLAENCLEIKNVPYLKGLKGMHYPDKNLILICKHKCTGITDYKITIAYELYHAIYENMDNESVELKAKKVVKETPEIIDFVIELFSLNDFKKRR